MAHCQRHNVEHANRAIINLYHLTMAYQDLSHLLLLQYNGHNNGAASAERRKFGKQFALAPDTECTELLAQLHQWVVALSYLFLDNLDFSNCFP